MKALGRSKHWISPEDYLEGELRSEVRHEYFAGEIVPMASDIVAMARASVNHNRIAGDIFAALNTHLRGKKCEAFMNDMKAHIKREDDDWFYYPDVMVNCDPAGQHKYFCDTPSVIIEVLSPETEAKDRREKRLAYEMIAALKTYVLVAQDKREVFIFRRTDHGWAREVLPDDGDALRLPDLEFTLPLDTIYGRTGL
jgi:Uma2 family endonuclease